MNCRVCLQRMKPRAVQICLPCLCIFLEAIQECGMDVYESDKERLGPLDAWEPIPPEDNSQTGKHD